MSGAGRPIALAVVRKTVATCWRHPIALAGLALGASGVAVGVLLAGSLVLWLGWFKIDFSAGMDRVGIASLVVWGALTVVQVGAATDGALRAARGESFGFVSALGTGFRRAPVVLVVAVASAAAVLAGTAALVAPGAGALASLCAAVPAAVAERVGPVGALARSVRLTRGDRVGLLAGIGALTAASPFFAVLGLYAMYRVDPGVWLAFAGPVWLALVVPLPAVAAAVAYAELRARKEPGAELARVFE